MIKPPPMRPDFLTISLVISVARLSFWGRWGKRTIALTQTPPWDCGEATTKVIRNGKDFHVPITLLDMRRETVGLAHFVTGK